jgi:hypothetical protein
MQLAAASLSAKRWVPHISRLRRGDFDVAGTSALRKKSASLGALQPTEGSPSNRTQSDIALYRKSEP